MEAGAYIVATGRGDFPNQVNNSLCFPGILKGALLARASGISDGMALRCAHSLAEFAKDKGISPSRILPDMEDEGLFAKEAADVAQQALDEGLARSGMSKQDVYNRASADIASSRALFRSMVEDGAIAPPPMELLEAALRDALAEA